MTGGKRVPASPVTISTYVNRRGFSRVGLQMSRDFALRIALGDKEALVEIERVIRKRIEKEENAPNA
jgi:hypothetical protein